MHLFDEIADFEMELNDYDERLNNIIMGSITSDSRPLRSQALGDCLSTAKPKQDQEKATEPKPSATDSIPEKSSQIQSMLKEIDDEFDELDNLLRDIDTLKLQDEPNHEERMSNSSYEMEIKAKRTRPNQFAPNQ